MSFGFVWLVLVRRLFFLFLRGSMTSPSHSLSLEITRIPGMMSLLPTGIPGLPFKILRSFSLLTFFFLSALLFPSRNLLSFALQKMPGPSSASSSASSSSSFSTSPPVPLVSMFSTRSLLTKHQQPSTSSTSSATTTTSSTASSTTTSMLEDLVRQDDLPSLTRFFATLQQHQLATSQLPVPFTPLVLAVSLGRSSFVHFFITQPHIHRHTRLWAACYSQATHVVLDLIATSNTASPSPSPSSLPQSASASSALSWSTLWAACAIGREDLVQSLLTQQLDHQSSSSASTSASSSPTFASLLNQGHEFDGTTPLGVALLFGHQHVAQLLLLNHNRKSSVS